MREFVWENRLCWACHVAPSTTWLTTRVTKNRYAMCKTCADTFPPNWKKESMVAVSDTEGEYFDE